MCSVYTARPKFPLTTTEGMASTLHHQQQVKADIVSDFKQEGVFRFAKSQLNEMHWDDTHWQLETPLGVLLDELGRAREHARLYGRSCRALMRYFALLYVFEQASRTTRLTARARSGPEAEARFVWQVSWAMTGQRHYLQFPWHCIHWELFLVGIKLGALLFEHARLSDAALVYHAVIAKNAPLCQGHPNAALHFFFSSHRHESEFCLLVEHARELLAADQDVAASQSALWASKRLQQIVAESPLLDAYYCSRLQKDLSRALPSGLAHSRATPLWPATDSDSADNADAAVGQSGEKDCALVWFSHVSERQRDARLLKMIFDNVDDAIYKQRNRDQRDDHQ